MKNFIVTFVCLLFSVGLFSQSQSIRYFHEQYDEYDDMTSFNLSGSLAGMMFSEDSGEEEVSKIFGFRMLCTDKNRNLIRRKDINELQHGILREGFEEWMVVREDGKEIKFMAKEEGDKITELLLMIDEPEEFALLSFHGEINPCKLAKACKDIEINGRNYMQHLEECE